ncbi:unnamed protein product [Protopolystoma xenopodis]|uniref:Uncharacterized protein n=1 Tax=Protopolystoma xenopodis TaxID=117903 RepID=A0A3S5AFG0_9PLAT|nr:unnamed protein product [Protopolystoma xenopodis]
MQVAHFYNSINSQMIPSQQALMLNSALAFERLIKASSSSSSSTSSTKITSSQADEQGPVTWDKMSRVETYISQLQTASRNLMSENRRLRKLHFTVIEKVRLSIN